MTDAPADDRPTRPLRNVELLRLSGYWLGLVAVFVGIGVILQERIKDLVPDPTVQRGGCVVKTDMGEVDARIERQFAEIERGLLTA